MDRPKDIQGLIEGLKTKNRQLGEKNDDLKDLSEKKAQFDRDYKIAYAREVMNLKLEKESVTLIPSLAKGDKVVAELCYKADVADGVYRACQEKIKDIRTHIDTYRTLLSWEKAEFLRTE